MARKGRRGSAEHIRTMDPVQYQRMRARSSLTYMPRIPRSMSLPLAMVQALFVQGVLSPEDPDLAQAPDEKFSDVAAYGHIRVLLKSFKLRVKQAKVRAALGIMVAFILALRSIFGTRGAWVLWNAVFESVCTGVQVSFPDKRENIAALKVVADEDSVGWDQYYPDYSKALTQLLEISLDRRERDRMTMLAAIMPEDVNTRIVVRDMARLTFQHLPRRPGRGEPTVSMPTGSATYIDSPIAESLLRRNPHLMEPAERQASSSPTASWEAFGAPIGGESVYRAGPSTWAEDLAKLKEGPLKGLPFYPVADWERHAKRLVPIQQFGSIRETHSGDRHQHSGLDVGAPEGTPVHAMYAGTIVEIESAWKSGGGPGGNLVRVRTDSGANGGVLEHGYYHLSETTKGLKIGQEVVQGQKIGGVGDTGNSTGPHLHLSTNWLSRERIDHGDSTVEYSSSKQALDPEQVLEDGAIDTARSAGLSVVHRAPTLSQGAFVLQSIGAEHYATPVQGDFLSLFEGAIRAGSKAVQDAGRSLAQNFPDQARGLEQFSAGVNEFGRQVVTPVTEWIFDPNGAIRAAMSIAMGTAGVPADQVNAVLDALLVSMRAGLSNQDAPEVFIAKIRSDPRIANLTPAQQAAIVAQAGNAYSAARFGPVSQPIQPQPGTGDAELPHWGDGNGYGTDGWDPEIGDHYSDDDDDDDELFDDPE